MQRLAALFIVMLAGCASLPSDPDIVDDDPDLVADAYDVIRGLMADVPCDVSAVGQGTSENLLLLSQFEGAGGSQEIDIGADMIMMARGGGFHLVDISDPLAPVELSNITDLGGNLDVKFSPDNKTAFVGTGGGVTVVDISDPRVPMETSRWSFADASIPTDPAPRALQNAHMLYTAHIADEDWLFISPNSNTGVWILRIVGEPHERSLEFVTQTLPVQGGPLGPHDMYVQKDELTGDWLLYSSDGFHGWTVFDVNDPTSPTLAGGFVRPETGYTHTIQAATIDGRRIVATIAEVGANFLQIYDATVLQAPVLLASWQASPASTAPQHNFNIVNGSLYLAHYTSGFYVFDLHQLPDVPAIGTLDFAPQAHYSAGVETAAGPLSFGYFWDIVLWKGLLYGSSMEDGVHVVGYGCNEPGDPAVTSTG